MKVGWRFFVGGSLFLVGFVAIRFVFFAADPWQDYLSRSMAPESPIRPESSPFSEAFHTENAWLINEIARRSRWDAGDTDRLVDLIGSGFPDIPGASIRQAGPDLEAWMVFTMAMSVVCDRMMYGVPTDERVREAFALTIVELLEHPRSYARVHAVGMLMNSGMIDRDEALLDRVERIAQADPDPSVRRTAQLKLDHHAGKPVMLEDCPTCPRDGP